jgi:hypothetical protein
MEPATNKLQVHFPTRILKIPLYDCWTPFLLVEAGLQSLKHLKNPFCGRKKKKKSSISMLQKLLVPNTDKITKGFQLYNKQCVYVELFLYIHYNNFKINGRTSTTVCKQLCTIRAAQPTPTIYLWNSFFS